MGKYHLARVAYDAYAKKAGGKSLVTQAPLPEFDALPEVIKKAWDAAAYAVVEANNEAQSYFGN